MRSPCCLSDRLCPPILITLSHLVDFHEIQQGVHAIESDIVAIILIA
jgi:hypothetical protein